MSLREDAIEANRKQNEKWTKEAAERLAAKREEYRKIIAEVCKDGLGRTPDSIMVDESGNRFSLDGLVFIGPPDGGFYGNKWRLDLGVCPSCEEPIWSQYTFSLWKRKPEAVLASVGEIIENHERGGSHTCRKVSDAPANPVPPQTVTYRHGGVEHSLLESIREYVFDAIEQEREGR